MQPLNGVRIIDMTDERGALCGRVLADLGADVIYVEPPSGSPFRHRAAAGTRWPHQPGLRLPQRRQAQCDRSTSRTRRRDARSCIASSRRPTRGSSRTRPARSPPHGLDPAAVRGTHPALVITSITDFGQSGPYRDYLGTDMIGYAMGGMLYRAGAAHRPPVVAPGSQAYDTAGVTAAFATVTALYHRRATGRGDWLDVSVQEATANLADWSVPLYSMMAYYTHREGAGMYPVYRCADGWVRLIVIGVKHWRALRAWMGEPAELQDPIVRRVPAAAVQPRHDRADHPALLRRAGRRKRWRARRRRAASLPRRCSSLARCSTTSTPARAARSSSWRCMPGLAAKMPSGFFEIDGVRCGPTRGAPAVGEHDASGGRGVRAPRRRGPPTRRQH